MGHWHGKCVSAILTPVASRRAISAVQAFAAALFLYCGLSIVDAASAQSVTPQAAAGAILADGDAVVTGFSGVTQVPGTAANPADLTFIDANGPSARVVDLQGPGAPPQAQLLTDPKPFTLTASQIGQVFGVALDDASPPNVYLAATSVYGLPIVVPAADGSVQRAKIGGAGASFMPGLFGPATLQGEPGSIWRVDGVTGQVSLFANVVLNGIANSGPGLGGLAFDPASGTLFVADRATGMIHGFDRQGKERAVFDHGVQGRPAAGLNPVAFDPAKRLDIANPAFNSEDSRPGRTRRRSDGCSVSPSTPGGFTTPSPTGCRCGRWRSPPMARSAPIRASRFRPRRAPPATRSPRSRSTIRAGCCSRNAPRPPALTISPR